MHKQTIKLSYDALIAILQGREFHLQTKDNEFVFLPPFNGVFITHEQLANIRYQDQVGLLGMIKDLQEYKEETK